MNDLLRTADLSRDDLLRLLELAEAFKRDPDLHRETLRGQVVVLCGATPFPLARLPFEAAVARLGGTSVAVSPDELPLGPAEIEDTARVVSRLASAVVILGVDDDAARTFADTASIPVINARTVRHRPCQSLADLLTIREHYHHYADRTLAYLGDGNDIAHSLLEGAALVGMNITVATPPAFEPSAEIVGRAEQLADVSGAWIELTNDPQAAVKNADVVYTDVWRPAGGSGSEWSERRRSLSAYRVTPELLAEANRDARFMHGMPAHRGDEVTADVIDGPQSIVFDQAANLLPTVQAVLAALVERHLETGAA